MLSILFETKEFLINGYNQVHTQNKVFFLFFKRKYFLLLFISTPGLRGQKRMLIKGEWSIWTTVRKLLKRIGVFESFLSQTISFFFYLAVFMKTFEHQRIYNIFSRSSRTEMLFFERFAAERTFCTFLT